MYIRFVAGDPAFLSPFHLRDSVSLSLGYAPGSDHWRLFEDADRLLVDAFAARPHWGKLFLADAAVIAPLYERLADFQALADRLDRRGAFRNAWLERHVLGVG
jgi:xylitol oxidase